MDLLHLFETFIHHDIFSPLHFFNFCLIIYNNEGIFVESTAVLYTVKKIVQ